MKPTETLQAMFEAAVAAAQATTTIAAHLPSPPKGRTIVIGAGKASGAMAQAFEKNWKGKIDVGLVLTRYDYGLPCEHIEIVEASHPVPDAAGQQAAARIREVVQGLSADDLVICLISGGGSSLLSQPASGLTLEDKQDINKRLLKSGATISEMNCVRKHLSTIKGGQLAAACAPAKVFTLLISDVPGDDPSSIASGPTVPDPTTFADAQAIIDKYQIDGPPAVLEHIRKAEVETPKPGDSCFDNTETHMIAAPQMSLEAAAEVAREHGYTPLILGDSIEGEASDVALVHAGIAQQVVRHGQPVQAPCVLLSGGETTVTVRGKGRGGRNAEFALALAVALNGMENVYAIACDTDGIDGTEDNAGAIVTPDTLKRAEAKGLNAKAYLANNDGYSFFEGLEDLVITGPTFTNVNDLRAIIINQK